MGEALVKEKEKTAPFLCGVCLRQFTRNKRAPVSLNCGHVFCATCVPQMYKRGDGDGGENAEDKMLLQCGNCREITYSKRNQMKKCLMLVELIEKQGELAESDMEEEEDAGEGSQPETTISNQFPEENSIDELNAFYRHAASAEVRETITQILAFGIALRQRVDDDQNDLLKKPVGLVETLISQMRRCVTILDNIKKETFVATINELANIGANTMGYLRDLENTITVTTDVARRLKQLQQPQANEGTGNGGSGIANYRRSRRRRRAHSPPPEEQEGVTAGAHDEENIMRCETRSMRRRRLEREQEMEATGNNENH